MVTAIISFSVSVNLENEVTLQIRSSLQCLPHYPLAMNTALEISLQNSLDKRAKIGMPVLDLLKGVPKII